MFVTFVMPIHNHDMSHIWMSHVSHIDPPCVDVPDAFVTPFVTPNAATHCTPQHTATHCTLQYTAIQCNTPQHTAAHCLPSLAVPAAFVTQNPPPTSTTENTTLLYIATHRITPATLVLPCVAVPPAFVTRNPSPTNTTESAAACVPRGNRRQPPVVCCSVLQCVAVCCSVVQCGAVRYKCGAMWCTVVQCGAVWCSVM